MGPHARQCPEVFHADRARKCPGGSVAIFVVLEIALSVLETLCTLVTCHMCFRMFLQVICQRAFKRKLHTTVRVRADIQLLVMSLFMVVK